MSAVQYIWSLNLLWWLIYLINLVVDYLLIFQCLLCFFRIVFRINIHLIIYSVWNYLILCIEVWLVVFIGVLGIPGLPDHWVFTTLVLGSICLRISVGKSDCRCCAREWITGAVGHWNVHVYCSVNHLTLSHPRVPSPKMTNFPKLQTG